MYSRALRAAARLFAISSLLAMLVPAWAQQQSTGSQPAGDNTQMNQRDRQAMEPTADQQKDDSTDRQLAQKIRQSIVRDKSLSTYAHNVKVIAEGGKVTLKGPVRSEDEKNVLAAKAAEIAGPSNVDNELNVVPK